jgi:hypothetical protein
MNRSVMSLACAALLAVAMMAPREAHADGGDLAAGLFGGLVAGAVVGSALAPRGPQPVLVAPEPYDPEPVCFGRAQVYDPSYRIYRWQRVRVPCD